MERIIKYLCCLLAATLALVACDKEDPEAKRPLRTVLFYFAGDNNLGYYIDQNVEGIKNGISQAGITDGNIVIYTDKRNETPRLFYLKLERGTVREIEIERYEEGQNSATAATLSQIIEKSVRTFPADSYGLVLWSHGTGWLPHKIGNYLRSFGEDNGQSIELNDLADALSPYHFDFLLFDACYMASTEVVYALRNQADYIIGSPTEILAEGFPYQSIVGPMFEPEPDVREIASRFYTYYQEDAGTVSVVKCDELGALADACRPIFSGKTEEELFAVPVEELQIMEYLKKNYHALYDLEDYVSHLAEGEPYETFKRCLEKAVVYKATTPKAVYAYGGGLYLPVNTYSGLSIYVPQADLNSLNEWYKGLDWYQAVYGAL